MESEQYRPDNDRPPRWGYILAIIVSALAHAGLFYLVLVVLPRLLTNNAPPPAYTVKIVDTIPAGDLGTHLPRLSQNQPTPTTPAPQASEPPPPPPSTPPPIEEEADENAVALNTLHQTRYPDAYAHSGALADRCADSNRDSDANSSTDSAAPSNPDPYDTSDANFHCHAASQT